VKRRSWPLHLLHDLQVETADPFEQFRVVAGAVSGTVLFLQLVGKYIAAKRPGVRA
jgi:hypothetical protein